MRRCRARSVLDRCGRAGRSKAPQIARALRNARWRHARFARLLWMSDDPPPTPPRFCFTRPVRCATRSPTLRRPTRRRAATRCEATYGAVRHAARRGSRPARRAEVFASANMTHPQSLAKAGKSGSGRAVRAQPAVRAGAARPRGHARDAARADAEPGREGRHLDAEGRSVRRLCVRGVREGRRAEGGSQCRAGERRRCKLSGGRTARSRRTGRNLYGWHVAEGRADIFSRLLHRRASRRSARIPASRSSPCPKRSRSAPTMG